MFLVVIFVCIFLTVINQFPSGVTLESPVTFYSINNLPSTPLSFFDHDDTFVDFYIYDKTNKRAATAAEVAFYLKKISVFSVTDGVATRLEMSSTGCPRGVACFSVSSTNAKAFLSATSPISGKGTTLNF